MSSTSSSAMQVGGLVSGLDTNAIIDGLTNIEQTRVNRAEAKRELIQKQREAFNELATRVYALSKQAEALSKSNQFNLFKASSNDEDIATVSAGENGSAGSFEIVAQQLATTQKASSRSFSAVNVSLNLTGTFEVSRSREAIKNDPTKKTTTIDIKATDALKDIVNKINSAEGAGVKASILSLSSGENRLVLTGLDQGSDGFYLKETAGDALSNPAGLGILNATQSVRTEFSMLKTVGGPAEGTTLFKDLFASIGGNKMDAGDRITISGTSADGAVTSTDFVIDPATSTVDQFLNQIRTTFGANTEVKLNQSGEIVLSNTGAGTATMSMNLTFVDQGAASSMQLGGTKAQNTFSNLINEGTKAFYLLDGMAVSSQSNTDSNTVVGTNIELKKADPTKTIKLGLDIDKAGIKEKIQTFVDEYNSVMNFIKEQTKVEVKDKGEEDEKSSTTKGPLANEASVRRLKSQLQSLVTSPVKELEGKTQYTSLARIGITTNRSTGTLEIDDSTLDKAMNTDLDGVKSLFIANGFSSNPQHALGRYDERTTKSGTYEVRPDSDEIDTDASAGVSWASATRQGDILMSKTGDSKGLSITAPIGSGNGTFTFSRGIASQLKMFIDNSKDPVDGFFIKTDQTFQSRITEYDKRIAKLEDQVENYRSRLTREYASLEQNMQKLNSQNAAFLSQMG